MSIAEIHKGDVFDCRDMVGCEVQRVGRATVWLVAKTDKGVFPFTAHPDELRRHVDRQSIRIGQYLIRMAGEGKLWITSALSGESMQTDQAKLESWLDKFWAKEF